MPELSKKSLILQSSYLYYVRGLNIQEISKQLGISRFRVSRYITEARERGMVSVQIIDPDMDCEAMALELKQKLQIDQVIVCSVLPNASREEIRHSIGKAGVQLLLDIDRKTNLAITWGRTVAYMVYELPKNKIRIKNVIEMAGSVGKITSSISAHTVAQLAAEKMDAHCIQFSAPIIVDSPRTANALLQETVILEVLEMAKHCDIAISGVGPVQDKDSSLSSAGFLSERDLSTLDSRCAVGSILGRFFDKDGRECNTEFARRVLALSFEDYLAIPQRIVLAGGKYKVESIYALAKNHVITTLVTDNETASLLLEKMDGEEKGR